MAKSARALDRRFIASLSHGLSVLEAVADSPEDITLADLAKQVGFKKTNTWRLVHTLVELGYLHQDTRTRNFRPAPRLLALGFAYFDGLDLKKLSLPLLQELAARHNETVNLAVMSGDELIYVERISSPQIVSINLHVGSRLPLYCTSLGRALICEMPNTWLSQYFQRISEDRKAHKYIQGDGKRLLQVLRETRERGYALNDEELVKGLRAVASPIRDRTSKIVAAVCISVPSSRSTLADLRRVFAPDLVTVAHNISLALGYRARGSVRNSTNGRGKSEVVDRAS